MTSRREEVALDIGGASGIGAAVVVALHPLQWISGQIIDYDRGRSLSSPVDSSGEVLRTTRER